MKTSLLVAAAALLSLTACQNEPEIVDSRTPDPRASEIANRPAPKLPPAVSASVTFRCQPGNTLLYVDFFAGDELAVLKTEKDGVPVALNAPAAGQPFVAEGGYKLTGGHKSATIQVAGAAAKTCKG